MQLDNKADKVKWGKTYRQLYDLYGKGIDFDRFCELVEACNSLNQLELAVFQEIHKHLGNPNVLIDPSKFEEKEEEKSIKKNR